MISAFALMASNGSRPLIFNTVAPENYSNDQQLRSEARTTHNADLTKVEMTDTLPKVNLVRKLCRSNFECLGCDMKVLVIVFVV